MGKRLLLVFVSINLMGMLAMASDDLFIGTWKLNPTKTEATGKQGLPFRSDTIIVEAQDNGLKFTFDRTDEDGKPIHFTDAARFDGKDYPAGHPMGGTISLKKIDANSFERVTKTKGKAIGKYRMVVLRKGKMSMVTAQEKDSNGKKVTQIAIYDKQRD